MTNAVAGTGETTEPEAAAPDVAGSGETDAPAAAPAAPEDPKLELLPEETIDMTASPNEPAPEPRSLSPQTLAEQEAGRAALKRNQG